MNLKNIPMGSFEALNVLVEIPKGSKIKYEYDEEIGVMRLDFVFYNDFEFIYNYGLIPNTHAGDGDHLDAFVLGENPIASGTIVKVRPIGIVKIIDRGEEDNKILSVPGQDVAFNEIQDISDLREDLTNKFKEFFKKIGIQKNKKIEFLGIFGKKEAIKEIEKCKK